MNILLFLVSTVIGFCISTLYEVFIIKLTKKRALILNGYRFHHSIYGLIFIILSFSVYNFLFFFGIGIILQHTITDGFKFITKENKYES